MDVSGTTHLTTAQREQDIGLFEPGKHFQVFVKVYNALCEHHL